VVRREDDRAIAELAVVERVEVLEALDLDLVQDAVTSHTSAA